jgi:hypothetical protein
MDGLSAVRGNLQPSNPPPPRRRGGLRRRRGVRMSSGQVLAPRTSDRDRASAYPWCAALHIGGVAFSMYLLGSKGGGIHCAHCLDALVADLPAAAQAQRCPPSLDRMIGEPPVGEDVSSLLQPGGTGW